MLRKNDFSPEQLIALVKDHHKAGLTPAEVAAIDLAHKVVNHAYRVTQEDIERLRKVGYDEAEILDIVFAECDVMPHFLERRGDCRLRSGKGRYPPVEHEE